MRHIEKDFNNPPDGLMDSKWDELKKDAVNNPAHEANKNCYRDTTLDSLVKLYHNKCACCERDRGTELQIDHYRPRKARQYKKKPEYNHSGYHWLTYEWSNLIPLCSSCNNAKSNYFPIQKKKINDTSITSSQELHLKEAPLFINPEIEKSPEKHFIYFPDGKIEGRTDEGGEMVKLYKLNHKNLKRERKKIIVNYRLNIRKAIQFYLHKDKSKEYLKGRLESIFTIILENGKKYKAFSLMHIFIRNYFREFIAKSFPENISYKLNISFQNYLSLWKKNRKLLNFF